MALHRPVDSRGILKGDKSEALVSARLTVKHDVRIDHFAELRKEVSQTRIVD
jgi:hypothetical protein